jgi:hypothetical protein
MTEALKMFPTTRRI